jgi:hypothetical protein
MDYQKIIASQLALLRDGALTSRTVSGKILEIAEIACPANFHCPLGLSMDEWERYSETSANAFSFLKFQVMGERLIEVLDLDGAAFSEADIPILRGLFGRLVSLNDRRRSPATVNLPPFR